MITAEFNAWRKIRDWRGTVGWIHRSMLTGKRTVITTARELVLRARPSKNSAVVARAEAGVIARVLVCQADWCRIEVGGISGWGRRRGLWGILPEEKIK
jgi:SH3-like domain-containing protein